MSKIFKIIDTGVGVYHEIILSQNCLQTKAKNKNEIKLFFYDLKVKVILLEILYIDHFDKNTNS